MLSWRGLPSHPGSCQLPPLPWVRRQATTGPRAIYMQVCDYNCQWSPSLVTWPCSYCHRSWGKKKMQADRLYRWNQCENFFKVGKLLHRNNPTLSLRSLGPVVWWVIMAQDYIGCSRLLGLLQCSIMHCWTAFLAIESYCWFPLPNLLEQSSHARLSKTYLTEGLRLLATLTQSSPPSIVV